MFSNTGHVAWHAPQRGINEFVHNIHARLQAAIPAVRGAHHGQAVPGAGQRISKQRQPRARVFALLLLVKVDVLTAVAVVLCCAALQALQLSQRGVHQALHAVHVVVAVLAQAPPRNTRKVCARAHADALAPGVQTMIGLELCHHKQALQDLLESFIVHTPFIFCGCFQVVSKIMTIEFARNRCCATDFLLFA